MTPILILVSLIVSYVTLNDSLNCSVAHFSYLKHQRHTYHDFTAQDIVMRSLMGDVFGFRSIIKAYNAVDINSFFKTFTFCNFKNFSPLVHVGHFSNYNDIERGEKSAAIWGTRSSLEVALEKIMVCLRCGGPHSEGTWMVVSDCGFKAHLLMGAIIRQEDVGECVRGCCGVIAETRSREYLDSGGEK